MDSDEKAALMSSLKISSEVLSSSSFHGAEVSHIELEEIKQDSGVNSSSASFINSSSSSVSPTSIRVGPSKSLDPEAPGADIRSFEPFRFHTPSEIRFWVLALFTGFMSYLVAHWMPKWFAPLRYQRCNSDEADFILVTTEFVSELVPVEIRRETYSAELERPFCGLCSPSLPLGSTLPLSQRMFVFRYLRFVFEMNVGDFVGTSSLTEDTVQAVKQRLNQGISAAAQSEERDRRGPNQVNVIVKPWLQILVEEVFQPFFVFQIFSIILWLIEEYYVFAAVIAILATISVVTTLLETRGSLMRIAEMARHESMVTVLQDGEWQRISSTSLVPGDIVALDDECTLPCDIALLDGGCVVNEAMLTGESVPVVKLAYDLKGRKGDDCLSFGSDAQRTLFAATKVMQLKPSEKDAKVVGMVVKTGFHTAKGVLILSILYPRPSFFKFLEQTYLFVFTLFLVSLIGFGLTIWKMESIGAAVSKMIVRGLDLITIVVPPTLPLAMSVGTNFALICLRNLNIFCISPNRINMAGKVKLFCFDKTGTLTAEGLEMHGVRQSKNGSFTQIATEPNMLDSLVLQALACCQALALVAEKSSSSRSQVSDKNQDASLIRLDSEDEENNHSSAPAKPMSVALSASGQHRVVGDPLEIQTFQFTGARLQDSDSRDYLQRVTLSGNSSFVYHIKQQFEFSSDLRRMSVLAERQSDHSIFSFVKGSPEVLEPLCAAESIPSDFHKQLEYYTKQGFRVIGLAVKEMTNHQFPSGASKEIIRKQCESGLVFMGLVVMENKIKPETKPVLEELRSARVRPVMVTGDNALTAISVAKESGLIVPNTTVFVGRVNNSASSSVSWVSSDDENITLDPRDLHLSRENKYSTDDEKPQQYELAITGDVFAVLHREYLESKLNFDAQRFDASVSPSGSSSVHVNQTQSSNTEANSSEAAYLDPIEREFLARSHFHKVLLASQIFARMTPAQKALVVTEFQSLGLYVGMCGDGANDCAALKAAHVGVSLSESDASIAAPFTYKRPHIQCIPHLLREGRSALVTSFQLFRFMSMYSMIQFSAAILCYFQRSVLGNWQYLYQDLILVFPLTILMGMTSASEDLTVKRPSGNLLSVRNMLSTLSHMLLCFGFQFWVFQMVSAEPGFVDLSTDEQTPPVWHTTALYYASNFQYIFMAVLFSLGRPWKRIPLTNWKFSGWVLLCFLFSILLLFAPKSSTFFFTIDEIDIPIHLRRMIFLAIVINCAVAWVFELLLLPAVISFASSNAIGGSVFGNGMPKFGGFGFVKPFHSLRQAFESGWPSKLHFD